MRTSAGIIAVVLAACAPTVDAPATRQRAADAADAAQLGAQLGALPGVVRTAVTLRRPLADPLAPATPPAPATAGVVIVIDDRADGATITRAATALVRAAAPEVAAPALVVEVGAHRPALARVGPFTVEAASRPRLRATLVGGLALILGLASLLAMRERRGRGQRRGNSAQ